MQFADQIFVPKVVGAREFERSQVRSLAGWHENCFILAMLHWSLIFLIIALIAGLLGFTGIAGAAMGIAKILFFVFLVVWLVVLLAIRKAV